MAGGFEEFVQVATGRGPYPYQARLAAEGLPERLNVPTGAGKTVAAVLPWLYRRLVAAPESTPRRMVYVLPQHSIAEQAFARIGDWLDRLGQGGDVGLHLLEGAAALDGGWRRRPERTTILVGTHDLLLSRALMRGFADWRGMEAVCFGLLHSDTQWVFDEAHLLGAGLATGRSLQQLRELLGTAAPTGSMWMSSAGVAGRGSVVELGEADRQSPLAVRLKAVRRIQELTADPAGGIPGLARTLAEAHVPGTQSIAVLNTAGRAREFARELRKAAPGRDVLLLHRYFRAADQRRLLAGLTGGTDSFIVTTPALEAGLDLSSRTLLTELAPWPSLVQRAGRCNRYGEHPDGGDLLWCRTAGQDDAVAQWLAEHEGQAVTSVQLHDARVGQDVQTSRGPSLDDVLDLFDTAGEADVSHWIGAPADRTALVAWHGWEAGTPSEEEPDPGRGELCPVPLAELRSLLDGRAWVRDDLDGRWRPASASAEDLRPGVILLLDAGRGGYLPEEGWAPESRTPVEPLGEPARPRTFACTAWIGLDQHLMETEEEALALLDALPGLALAPAHRQAVALAARYHDLGKCHQAFQAMLRGGGGDPPDGLLAKSKAPYSTGENIRPHFRHELVSALMLLDNATWLPGDSALVTYLAAAHHGHIRITVRPRGTEAPRLRGVQDGDRIPPVHLSTGEHFPALTLRTAVFTDSWTDRAIALRDRPDLGPFRLAYLETLVRVADWRSSARHDGPVAATG